MKKDELILYAKANNIFIPSSAKKDEIITILEKGDTNG